MRDEKINSQYFIFLVFFYMFLFVEILDNYVSFLSYFDEIVALLSVPIFIIRYYKNKRFKKDSIGLIYIFLFIFICIGISGNIVYKYQPFSVGMSDAFLNTKFWLALYVGFMWGNTFDPSQYTRHILTHVRMVTWLYAILTIISNIFDVFDSSIRYGMKSTQLFYQHSTFFAANCAFLIIVLLAVSMKQVDYLSLVILIILLCSTLRAKALAASFIIIAIASIVMYKKRKITIKGLLFLAPFAVLIAWNKIQFYFLGSQNNDSARNMLMITSFKIAKDHFPLGSGMGTFACYLSGVHYSPIYEKYNIHHVNGLSLENHHYVSDSFWPMIIGQNGWIGLLLFVSIVVILYFNIQKIFSISKCYYTAALVGFVYLIISSTAESSFVHPMMLPIAIWIGVLISAAKKKQVDNNTITVQETDKKKRVYIYGRKNS